jgi:glycosyltransferase involved in cell wall biosynthesis
MISVLIPTKDSERTLVPTLSALVAGSAEGLVREVVLVDGGSTDGTAKIADAAGCEFRVVPGETDARLLAAAKRARGNWLLILDPASTLEEGWTREIAKFIESSERTGEAERRAATFRLSLEGYGLWPRLKELTADARLALGGRPRFEQGLLVARRFYQSSQGRVGRPVALRARIVLSA